MGKIHIKNQPKKSAQKIKIHFLSIAAILVLALTTSLIAQVLLLKSQNLSNTAHAARLSSTKLAPLSSVMLSKA